MVRPLKQEVYMTDDNMGANRAKQLAIRERLKKLFGDYRRTDNDQRLPPPVCGAPTSGPRAGP